jgi:hypothetical protein
MLAADYGVWPKILFGTDFPFTTVNESIEGLRAAARVSMGGFSLPAGKVEAIIHRNPLSELGL